MNKSKPVDDTPILEDQLGLTTSDEAKPQPARSADDITLGKESNTSTPKTDLRPWYKRPKLWVKIGLGSVGALLILLAGLWWYGRSQDLQAVKSHWLTVTQAADRVASESSRSSYDSFDPAYQAISDMDDKLTDLQRVNKAHFLGDSSLISSFEKVLDELKTYTAKAKSQTADLSRVGSSELDSLKSSSIAAKLTVDDFSKRSNVTDDSRISDDFFTLNELLDRIIKAHNDAEDTKKAEADAALSKEEQDKQDKVDAEEAASRWTQAYIAGSVADMKKYMTVPFTNEYDFSQVTASWRATNYPRSYRRVSTDKKSDAYEVVESITFVTKSDYTAEGTYSSTYVFLITQDEASQKWLINSQRYQ